MKVREVTIGMTVEHDGEDWTVWSRGPEWLASSFWLIREVPGDRVTKAVQAKDMYRGPRLRGHG